ncbi:hypothetical protein ZEAMMB73_Zm00001d030312 [Zea mays]|uniref:RRM domain-containing protein n=1 Tax=Zea mays TaxID=4577 RepID=A0A1D6KBW1_MAIZE|nr:hypothetical protein ZEAMMB73_Zm00001d030312 [Zea mays]ONM00792.1 hypothetical protein ZEAMMB73_Zm00001d030312 [Zea mays]
METSSSSSGLGGSYHHHRSRFGDTTLTKVFVGGLVWETPSEGLRHHFEAYGDILEVVVITGRETGCSKGYAEIVNPPWLDGSYFGDDDVGSSKRKYVTMLEFMPLELSLPSRSWRCTDPEGNIQPALRGLFPCAVSDGLCLSGGSPCKWYINPDVPEASALMTSATKAHSPIKWNEVLSSNQPMSHVPEEQKIAYIRDLHPFENKDREFLVTVTVKKIGNRWWYNACKKCTRTAVAHGDSYKCSDQVCANIGTPNQSGVEDTPNKASNLVMPSTLLTPQSSATSVQDKTFGIGSSTVVPGATPAITKELTSTPRKRTRSSPAKTVTKRLFTDVDGGIAGSKDAADSAAAPSSTKDA